MRLTRPSAPLVVATLALIVAAAQPSYATLNRLAKDSVGSPQIKSGGVHGADLAGRSVNSSKIADGTVQREDLAADAVSSPQIAAGSVMGSDLATGSVDFSKIADGTIGRAELASNSVDGTKLVDGSVSLADLAANAKPGRTVAGSWSRYPAPTTWTTVGALTSIGALSTDAGGGLVVGQSSLLLVTGQVRVRNTSTTAGTLASLDCSVLVNGTSVAATANVGGLAVGASTTVPIVASAGVAAGTVDVGVSCNGTNAAIQQVRVAAVAIPS